MANNIWLGTTSGDASNAANWMTGSVPASGDNIHFSALYNNPVTAGLMALNDSTLGGALGAVIVENGYSGTWGAAGGSDFQFTCTRFQSYGTGTMFVDLQASAIAPIINNSASPQNGQVGINIIGSALTTLNVLGGSVGVASQFGETATVATLRIIGSSAQVYVGSGVTLTTIECIAGGNHEVHCAVATINMYGGTLYTEETGGVTSNLNVYGGTFYGESTGTIAACNVYNGNGTVNMTSSTVARTISSVTVAGTGWTLAYDPAVVTVTAITPPTVPISLSAGYPY